MRFLLDLIPCYGSPGSKAGPSDHPAPPPPPPRMVRKTSRAPSWSPSLFAISEERAVMGGVLIVARGKVMASLGSVTGGNTRRTSGGRGPGSASRARTPYKDEYGHGQGYLSGTMIPAFSPAPFVF
ncbi:hypothetical protein MLD38_024940 [Melastoma candidum]|uniref:Uncharacterized protein n=1 Tax=Melastoma candidum TaxID=119954 RepID=A0ACB9NWP5_9MYRT|nr:hypothetical protein MLD38_024940 [Melastoma candidum]